METNFNGQGKSIVTTENEREARQLLANLFREYQERARPLVDILAFYASLRPPPLVMLTEEQATAMFGGVTDQMEKANSAGSGMADSASYYINSLQGKA